MFINKLQVLTKMIGNKKRLKHRNIHNKRKKNLDVLHRNNTAHKYFISKMTYFVLISDYFNTITFAILCDNVGLMIHANQKRLAKFFRALFLSGFTLMILSYRWQKLTSVCLQSSCKRNFSISCYFQWLYKAFITLLKFCWNDCCNTAPFVSSRMYPAR